MLQDRQMGEPHPWTSGGAWRATSKSKTNAHSGASEGGKSGATNPHSDANRSRLSGWRGVLELFGFSPPEELHGGKRLGELCRFDRRGIRSAGFVSPRTAPEATMAFRYFVPDDPKCARRTKRRSYMTRRALAWIESLATWTFVK